MIELELWHHYQLTSNLQCYFWCTTSGSEPVIKHQTKSQFTPTTNLRNIENDQAISPHYIYHLNQETENRQGDQI